MSCDVHAVMPKYQPELFNRILLLKLNKDISGRVEVRFKGGINAFPNFPKTQVTVELKDPVWNNLDWFENL